MCEWRFARAWGCALDDPPQSTAERGESTERVTPVAAASRRCALYALPMAPALLAPASPLLREHAVIGASTGYMESEREQWGELVVKAAAVSGMAAELSALSESELPSLVSYLGDEPLLPFRYLSVHGPSRERQLHEGELVELLAELPVWVDAIVMHPDTIEDASLYLRLGRRLVLENMDARKHHGRTADELAELFDALPEAGLCFDIAHAKAIDPTMAEGRAILEHHGRRLRHVHVSSLDEDSHHVPLSGEDELLYPPLLRKCRDVPWILEAPAA